MSNDVDASADQQASHAAELGLYLDVDITVVATYTLGRCPAWPD